MDGARVLMLEAGRNYDPATETPMFQTNAEAPLRGSGTPDKPFGFWDATIDGGWQVPGEPYTSASDDPARQFVWWRARMLGGRTNHWGRISPAQRPLRLQAAYARRPRLRLADQLRRPRAVLRQGRDADRRVRRQRRPREHAELAAGRAAAAAEAARQRPARPAARAQARHPGVAGHRAVLTTARSITSALPKLLHPGNAKAQKILAADMQKRAACFWATPCGRGCSIRANYQSTTVHLPPALATGNLDIVTDAMVRAVTKRADGSAEGVVYIDRKTGAEHRVKARIVVLAASALESVRILLNSGVANSQRQGRQIHHGHRRRRTSAARCRCSRTCRCTTKTAPTAATCTCRGGCTRSSSPGKLGFARGYHFEFGGGRRMPGMGTGAGLEWLNGGSYGKKFKEDARRYYGSFVGFAGRGEMIPNDDCYCRARSHA